MRGSFFSAVISTSNTASLLRRQTVRTLGQQVTRQRHLSSCSARNNAAIMGSAEGSNAWVGVKGAGSLDLRSDVMTTPTPSMLAAISRCTLRDDVFNEDPTTQDLEAHVASLTGKEAGLFVLSGTMGNQVSLRSLLVQPPHAVLADHRSHIICYEAGGVSSLTGATVKPVVPKNGIYLTLEDVKANVVISDNVHDCPTRVISLENTLNGMIMPLSEVKRISQFARENSIKMHCDGARLWEAVVAGAGTLKEFCAQFDTISLCFSKGLGAPVGSIIVGDNKTLQHARWTRKALGGGMRQPGFITACARVAVDETFGTKDDGSDGLLKQTHEMAKKVEALWTGMGGKLVHPVHTNMAWLDIEAASCSAEKFTELSEAEGLKVGGGRLVTHYQIAQNGEEVLARLERVFKKVFA
ncbi:hypothetical protein M441DRAFT_62088 [Trichoderma asperellum CBS 433.97]|uniref:Aromatic amino acid beta-eliminating lyase/threonine aldolase domain-containing protein n=2 Tax=Trichoderma asperellum TaxID=101201 RepID=A0A2T3YVQ0_TRIA4|nr:hypothetical protein M441DRAFT_62088 [Trichoderma asperellum CBS 433.97]PTB36614.1 hypothetical protein M441DRAFT_62088 [Trichoderma asperellum CBS 433.97]